MSTKISKPTDDAVARIANISNQIRQALRKSLPAPAEQFFTVMVPGKVVNFEEFTPGIGPDGKAISPLRPHSVQLAEAMLCDDMPALSSVQLGPTGRSVARSYGATLSKLCPAGSTTGIDDDSKSALSEQALRYKRAMEWLTSEDPSTPGKKRVEVYREKQELYTNAFEKKIKAFSEALDLAQKDPRNKTVEEQRQAYDKWVAENQKTYRNMCQAAYMDWVTIGKKEETEYWFSIVDNDSAMSRVEASKEAMRNAIISDTDGAVEYQKVKLDPSNWAWLAKQKAQSGSTANTNIIRSNIARLRSLNNVIRGLLNSSDERETANKDTNAEPEKAKEEKSITPRTTAADEYIAALQEYQSDKKKRQKKKIDGGNATTAEEPEVLPERLTKAREALFNELGDIHAAKTAEGAKSVQASLDVMLSARASDLRFQLRTNEELIRDYESQLAESQTNNSEIHEALAQATGMNLEDPTTNIGASAASAKPADPWTNITLSIESSSKSTSNETSANSYSANTSVSFGFWTIGGSVSHSDESSKAMEAMASSKVNISFDCMRVDISRSWLRPELFYDHDLKPAPGRANYISPGPIVLASLLDGDSYEQPKDLKLPIGPRARDEFLNNYSLFPMFPTAFLLAANVVLEIEEASAELESQINKSQTSGSAGISYGPFSIAGGGSSSSSKSQSTATSSSGRVRIEVKAPQIIGWISQIVPALPRPGTEEP